jgi:16S rRNA (cytidine1402-2'-O)-methyltransferase
LTKLHEEIVRGTAGELAERYAGGDPKGEIVIVVGPLDLDDSPTEEAVAAMQTLLAAGAKRRVAAQVVAQLTGTSANKLYDIASPDP